MKQHRTILAATVATILTMSLGAATITPISPRSAEGVPYDWTVSLGANDTAELINHFGAWSWEDNALFDTGAGEPPVGWTHTSRWVAVSLTVPTRFVVRLERQENVPWPSGGDPNRVASTNSMFPSFTIWQGHDVDGLQDHTFDNRGNPVWAEDLSFIGLVDNSTETSIERSFVLPAGSYTLVLGSNAPATDPNRQGFKATLSTAPIATQVALSDGNVPGLTGVTFKKIYSPTINDADQIAFRAQLAGSGISSVNDVAILSDTGATPLAIVAQEGSAAGATGSTFASFSDPVTDNHDNVLFLGKIKQGIGGVTAANDQGIWRYVALTGATQLIARESDPAPGATDGAAFKSFKTAVADASGGAFLATLNQDGTIVTSANDEGVWVFNDAGIATLVARQGHPFEVAAGDSRVVKALHFLTAQPGSRGAGRSTNAGGGRVLLLTFADGTSGVFHVAP